MKSFQKRKGPGTVHKLISKIWRLKVWNFENFSSHFVTRVWNLFSYWKLSKLQLLYWTNIIGIYLLLEGFQIFAYNRFAYNKIHCKKPSKHFTINSWTPPMNHLHLKITFYLIWGPFSDQTFDTLAYYKVNRLNSFYT